MSWMVYILECEDGSLYTGITTDMNRRIQEHKSGKGGNYTRSHKPLRLVYTESCRDRSDASKREYEIKALSRKKKLEMISEETGEYKYYSHIAVAFNSNPLSSKI